MRNWGEGAAVRNRWREVHVNPCADPFLSRALTPPPNPLLLRPRRHQEGPPPAFPWQLVCARPDQKQISEPSSFPLGVRSVNHFLHLI